jgi:hypothetical protein
VRPAAESANPTQSPLMCTMRTERYRLESGSNLPSYNPYMAYLPALSLFLYLQILDVLTTLSGFSLGVPEGSPFVQALIRWGPVAGTVLSKVVAVAVVGACFLLGKPHLVRWINYWYAGLVVWNVCIVLRVLTANS